MSNGVALSPVPVVDEEFQEFMFPLLGGVNTFDNPAMIPQDASDPRFRGLLSMAQANDVYAPFGRYDLQTRPGMADVRATAINASGVITGMKHQGDIADNFLLAVSIAGTSHNLYQDSANPPVAIAGGTNLTIGATNLVDMLNFTNGTNTGTICLSRLRDTPQFITGGVVRSNLSITSTLLPQFGEVFFQRALYGAPSVSGTVQATRVYWTDIRTGLTITDPTTQFESFETESGGSVLALRRLSEVCMVGLMHDIFLLATNPLASKPFAMRKLPLGKYRGPVSHQGVVEAEGALYWISQVNLHRLDLHGVITDMGDAIQPTIAGLNDANRQYAVADYDSVNHLVLFSVYNGSSATANLVIALNIRTGAIYLWTLSVNSMAQRLVSSDNRLILGGYSGLFRNWNSGSTGVADNAATAIDADVFTPRHHLGKPDWVKLFGYVKIVFDPQASESVTVQYRLDDATTWTSFAESPFAVTSTTGDESVKLFRLMKAGTHLQLRFRDNTSGESYRIVRYGIGAKLLHPAYVHA